MADDGTAGVPDPNPWQQPQQPGWQSPSHEYRAEPTAATWSSPSSEYGSYQTPPPNGAPWMYGSYQQPPKKSRTGLIVGLAVGAAVLLLGGGLAVVGLAGSSERTTARNDGDFTPAASVPTPSPSSPAPTPSPTQAAPGVTLKVPGSVAGYGQMKGSIAKRTIQDMRRKMGKAASGYEGIFDKSKIALYAKGSSRLVFIGLSGADSPLIAGELSRSPSGEVDSVFMGGGISDPKDYSAGSRGGVLRCGKTRQQGISVSMCAWADQSALITLQANGVSPKKLSSIMLSFHDASVRKGGPVVPA
jgi:hypothetical protein